MTPALDEDGDVAQAQPDGLGTRLAIALARQDAAAPGDEAHDRVERRRLPGQGFVVDDEGRLPLLGLEQQVSWQFGRFFI